MINSVGDSLPVQKAVTQPVQKQLPVELPKQLPAVDRLEVSGISHMLQTLKANDVRADLVSSVRQQIEAGTYQTDQKLTVAVNRLLEDLTR